MDQTSEPGEKNAEPILLSNLKDRGILVDGNRRSTRFTPAEAEAFAPGWTVVEHIANTATGFSGTLFKYEGPADPTLDLIPGELVLTFRSTEACDDTVRDCIATNLHEIKNRGWAFGQIDDMRTWTRQPARQRQARRPVYPSWATRWARTLSPPTAN